ncbi:MAG: oxidoreductase [Rhizobiales bacterium 12-68-15]|nr:MAG: oxidoreductase [Rhizobiales bacterium 12-68-15]
MPLVKNGAVVPDAYVTADAEGPLPDGPVIVPLARLLAEGEALSGRNAPLGVRVPNTADLAALVPFLPSLSLVALDFPKFRDGRAYTQARLLRERHGLLRATGNVLRDQILLMARCGFDAFEITRAEDVPGFVAGLSRYSVFYQPTGDGRRTVAGLRAAGA